MAGDKTGANAPARRTSLLQKLVSICDRYGQTSAQDPRRQPQTLSGVLVTLVCCAITAVLIASTGLKLMSGKREVRMGVRAPLNGLYKRKTSPGNSSNDIQTWPQFYVPSLELKFENKLIFYQRPGDRSPIFKIEVRDRNGYHRTYTSDEQESPVGFATYSVHEVPINSFDQRVNKAVPPPISSTKFNLGDKLYFANIAKFLEPLQIVRALSRGTLGGTEKFVDHQATLFVRFKGEQLKRLKKCQLQMLLYSEGQFSELADRGLVLNPENLQKRTFTAQESNPITWLPSSFKDGEFAKDVSLVVTKAKIDEDKLKKFFASLGGDPHTRDMMDWSYVINYVNNFNYTYSKETCDSDSEFRSDLVSNVPLSRLTETSLSLDWSPLISWPFPPFQIMLQAWGRRERVTVTDLTVEDNANSTSGKFTVMRLARPEPPERRVPSDPTLLAKSPWDPDGPNRTWHCPMKWYGDGLCNCECGGRDVDCLTIPVAVTGCEGKGAYGSLCDLDARCAAAVDLTLTVSEGCMGTGLHVKGENMLVGLQGDFSDLNAVNARGDAEEGCVQCPGDSVFQGTPRSFGSGGDLMCNPPARAWISADFNSQDLLVRSWGSTYPAADGSKNVEVVVGAQMAPGLMIPDPSTNRMAPKGGFAARVTVGTLLMEEVLLLKVEPLGFGSAALTLRSQGFNKREGSLLFRNKALLFGTGDYCTYGLVGELVSVIASKTRKVEMLLPNNVKAVHPELVKIGYYFPKVSPHPETHEKSAYEININGRSLNAAEVTRLEEVTWDGKLRYIQTVFLEQAPTFNMGEEGFIFGNQAAGTTELAVEGKSLLVALSLLDLSVKPLPKLHVMGPQQRMSFRVTKVDIDPPAGTKADGARGKLTIDRALSSDVLDGNTIFVAIDSGLLTNGSAVEKRYHGCDKPAAAHVYAVQTLEVVSGDREAYLPADRHKRTSSEKKESPPVINVESAVFVNLFVPKDPSSATPLCPNISLPAPPEPAERFRQKGWDQWSVFREASVEACKEFTIPAEVCAAAREQGGSVKGVCPEEMPPTKVSTFEYHFPVNHKWQTKYPIYDRNTINDPEYLVDIVYDYHMTYDQSMVKVENAFNAHQAGQGDLYVENDGSVQSKFFAGSPDYMGRPFSHGIHNQLGNLVPASDPLLSGKLTLMTSPYSLDDLETVQKNGGGTNWPWKDPRKSESLLEGFLPLTIDFDFGSLSNSQTAAKGLSIRPGYEYRFEAFVRLEPQMQSDPSGGAQVQSWRSIVVRKKVGSSPLSPDEPPHLARVRYSISLDSTAMSSMQTEAYPWQMALTDIIASTLFLYVGLCALVIVKRILHSRTFLPGPPDESVPRKQPKYLQELMLRIADLKKNA